MNESEWLTSTDPVEMMRVATGSRSLCCGCIWCDNGNGTVSLATGQKCCSKCDNSVAVGYTRIVSDRKLRLFACAVVRCFWAQLTDGMRAVVEVAERMADGLASDEDFYAASQAEYQGKDRSGDSKLRVLIHKCAANLSWDGPFMAKGTVEYAMYLNRNLAASIAALLLEIVGNLFRPVVLPLDVLGKCETCNGRGWTTHTPWRPTLPTWTCSCQNGQRPVACSWLTPTVRAIARKAYDERPGRVCERCKGDGEIHSGHPLSWPDCPDCQGTGRIEDGTLCPDTLGVLADALEDAGCPAELEEECGVLLSERACAGGRPFTHFPNCPDCKGSGKIRIPNPILAHLRTRTVCGQCYKRVDHLISSQPPRYGGCLWCGSFETRPAIRERGDWVLDLILGME